MTAVPAPVSSTAAGALSAFLRGVERRALVVAELQCGDAARAEQTLVAVMRAFAAVASDLPMAQWPTRFWTLLGQRQALREPVGGQWLPPLAALGEMGPLPRLAFLLRVGGSLDEGIAMRVLDQDEAGYQHLLADACPRDAHGQPDASAWRQLAEQVQLRIRDLPAKRLQQLQQPAAPAASNEAPATSWRAPQRDDRAAAQGKRRRPNARPRWRGPVILLVTVAVLLAAALGWRYWQGHSSGSDAPLPEGVVGEAGPVTVEALPPSKVNATPDATPAQASDDAMMLADRDYPLVADADLYAWTAAGGPLPVDESQSRPSRPEPASATLETAAADE
ncbi:TPA: hypothetical protein UL927_002229 [Stenotrophomonas maltophilia]|uniref:hypothetical protein n=1 Tax=Stenotrophomonas TaxID=40323 RepID=UPI0002B8BDF8|nr:MULTISPECIES: hypothetical protein [Stenotrophomonas]MCV4211698.1 hypothetical protein [Pseudomonas cichorii]EMF59787.1 Hypothetical protein EPM1_3494 [Stenotrophomonas maltophilia EPM1]KWV55349.1 hypothetical protein AS591_00245 [Stenotrophomonas maltophilia]KWV55495.1 hypothetical protein AS591_01040 [Stenotrophomonas maltophilia]MBA0459297.1 hypothetical protein [Stenotrophomonas maltophilia]